MTGFEPATTRPHTYRVIRLRYLILNKLCVFFLLRFNYWFKQTSLLSDVRNMLSIAKIHIILVMRKCNSIFIKFMLYSFSNSLRLKSPDRLIHRKSYSLALREGT